NPVLSQEGEAASQCRTGSRTVRAGMRSAIGESLDPRPRTIAGETRQRNPMLNTERSAALFERNRRVIPGGVVSLNRLVQPEIAFTRGRGSRVWDLDGNEFIDYHAGFAPYLLGHNDPDVNAAVRRALDDELTLMGSGTNPWEVRLAELIVQHVPSVEAVQLTNTGSEATFHAVRLARAHTGRDGVIIMQGGYNGWHND